MGLFILEIFFHGSSDNFATPIYRRAIFDNVESFINLFFREVFLEFDVYSYSETDIYDSMIDSEELLFYGFMWKLNLRCG